jgi:hypothetical protein
LAGSGLSTAESFIPKNTLLRHRKQLTDVLGVGLILYELTTEQYCDIENPKVRLLLDWCRNVNRTKKERKTIWNELPSLKMYSSSLRNFLVMIFEDRSMVGAPLSLQELLEHEFLTNFEETDFDPENQIPWYHNI